MPRRNQQVVASGAEIEGVRLLRAGARPLHKAARKVAGVDQRNRVPPWVRAQQILRPKVHDSPGGYSQAKIRQARLQARYLMTDRVSIAVGNDVDENMGIAQMHKIVMLDGSNPEARTAG